MTAACIRCLPVWDSSQFLTASISNRLPAGRRMTSSFLSTNASCGWVLMVPAGAQTPSKSEPEESMRFPAISGTKSCTQSSYLVSPPQPWLDGINAGEECYSPVRGHAAGPGLYGRGRKSPAPKAFQLMVFESKPGRFGLEYFRSRRSLRLQ